MTLTAVLVLALGTYALRLAGPVCYQRIRVTEAARDWLTLPAVALLSALAATATLLPAGHFGSPARAIGVGMGILACLRGVPFAGVVLLAALTTALLRLFGIA